MQVLSKEEEIKRCQDTVTRLILAFRGLDQHDRSGGKRGKAQGTRQGQHGGAARMAALPRGLFRVAPLP